MPHTPHSSSRSPPSSWSIRTCCIDRFAAFLSELGATERARLVTAPAAAGLDWSPASLDRPLGQRFFSVLNSGPRCSTARSAGRASSGRSIAGAARWPQLAHSTLLLLDTGEQRRARELLRGRIGTKAGAAVVVPALLTAGWEDEVARELVELTRYEEDPAARMAEWYFDVCPREGLSTEHQAALIVALYEAVSHDEAPLLAVARRGAEAQSDLGELYENAGIPPMTRITVEATIYNSATAIRGRA